MKIHIVQKGDTLWEIAKKYDVDFEELKQQNSHLASPDMIMPGMKIKIPTHSKKITTKDKKHVVSKKEIKTEPPVKAQPPKVEKSIELPKMPTFPLEQEEFLPIQDKKVKEYPTTMMPELPETPKKHEKPKTMPKQEVKPEKIVPPKESFQPIEQPVFMPPIPNCPPPQMMPMVTYPCHGPMPMPVQPMGCGCGCGAMQGFPYGYYRMPQPMYPVQNQGMYPDMMAPPIGNQSFTENSQQPLEPQMYPTDFAPPAQTELSAEPLPMYPEPPLGMRDQEQELSPTPYETSGQQEEELESNDIDELK